jgi:biopolymer transport protein ExbD
VQEPAPATVGYYGQAQWDDLLPWVVLLRSRQPAQRPSADQPPGGGSANRANPKGEPAAASPQAAEHAGTINPQIPPQSSAPGDLENSAFVRIAKAAPFLYLDNIPVTLEKLEAELRVRLARNPELRLSVGSDKDAPVKEFNKVKNVVRSVGITQFRAFSENRASGSEHAYRNKPPSAWLSELNITGGGDDQPAMEAIREMGTNAFPTLIQMLVKSSGDESLPSREQLKAMYVFGQLGPAARTAVPPLIDLLGSTHHQQIIIDTLVQIGVETVLPTLTAALTNQNPMVRIGMVKTLQEFPQRAETTVPLLVGLLKDDLPEVRAKAAQALGAVAKESEIAVPALIPLLTDGNEEIRLIAAASLGNYGTSAKAAKPDLLRLLQGTPFSTDLHGAARVALLQIDPDISFSRLQFRLVAKEGSNAVCDEYPDPLNPDNTLRVLKPVLLSEDSVASALFSRHLVSKEPEIKLALTDDGAAAFTRLTANNVHRQLAIIFDGKLLSAPIIHERISGGRISITGRLALAEAQTIMLILNRVNLDLSGRVTVTGEVNRPSLVVLPGTKIRVIDAINAAGGFTTFAIGPVLLTREGKIIGLKIREVRENTGRAKSLYLEPGDIIEALRSVL